MSSPAKLGTGSVAYAYKKKSPPRFKGNSNIDKEILIYTNKTLIFVETRDDKLSKTSIRSKKYSKFEKFYLREKKSTTFFREKIFVVRFFSLKSFTKI